MEAALLELSSGPYCYEDALGRSATPIVAVWGRLPEPSSHQKALAQPASVKLIAAEWSELLPAPNFCEDQELRSVEPIAGIEARATEFHFWPWVCAQNHGGAYVVRKDFERTPGHRYRYKLQYIGDCHPRSRSYLAGRRCFHRYMGEPRFVPLLGSVSAHLAHPPLAYRSHSRAEADFRRHSEEANKLIGSQARISCSLPLEAHWYRGRSHLLGNKPKRRPQRRARRRTSGPGLRIRW
jgi:hypothetical protein